LGSKLLTSTVKFVKFHAPFSAQPIDAVGSYPPTTSRRLGLLSLLLVSMLVANRIPAQRKDTIPPMLVTSRLPTSRKLSGYLLPNTPSSVQLYMIGDGVGEMHIGLIGGIGLGATDFYYRRLVSTFARKNATLELTIVRSQRNAPPSYSRLRY
jgi:hypothetical protein